MLKSSSILLRCWLRLLFLMVITERFECQESFDCQVCGLSYGMYTCSWTKKGCGWFRDRFPPAGYGGTVISYYACYHVDNFPGYYAPGDGNKQPCSIYNPTCTPGWYATPCGPCDVKRCHGCPDGFWCQNEQKYPCTQCATIQVMLSKCTATSDTVCKECRELPGHHYTVNNATVNAACVQCPENTILLKDIGSYLSCVCAPGMYGRVTSPTTSTCQPCPPGKFCPRPTSTEHSRVCPCA